jgi:hypothetical protein
MKLITEIAFMGKNMFVNTRKIREHVQFLFKILSLLFAKRNLSSGNFQSLTEYDSIIVNICNTLHLHYKCQYPLPFCVMLFLVCLSTLEEILDLSFNKNNFSISQWIVGRLFDRAVLYLLQCYLFIYFAVLRVGFSALLPLSYNPRPQLFKYLIRTARWMFIKCMWGIHQDCYLMFFCFSHEFCLFI